ncbi:DUF429 domain-containing protein [Lentimicrobium sp. S6]|uniref:DUF429 domain-containing protein n=1 Tax=Lentimicrobium sp. S6 TaxID=2735872 RepID=UPI0015571AA9|nr:DUF429 domain-containing protein [Lentimicrobium sp. S6]NPD43979.1 DUF429 domain-containing protein [Lentimicrobium sp. S6]
MKYAGIDLAWKGETNPSAIAVGNLKNNEILLEDIHPQIFGLNPILEFLKAQENLQGITVDASLKIPNKTGYRKSETDLNKVYRNKWAGCYPTNQNLYPNAFSVRLSERLEEEGFKYGTEPKWQMECYPHASLIEIFGLTRRLVYKKGKVGEKIAGQVKLAELLLSLQESQVLKLIIPNELTHFFDFKAIQQLKGQSLKSNEDALDAVVCLYTAALFANKHAGNIYGDLEEGFVWVPDNVL